MGHHNLIFIADNKVENYFGQIINQVIIIKEVFMNIYSFRTLLFVISFAFLFIFIHNCKDREEPRKVSLYKRAKLTENHAGPSDRGSLRFGFDLRLGPKEDVRIYLPFLNFLEQHTGRSFSLRFTEKYEDTVENLGKGITDFAALGPVNCVIAKKKYGAGCLVMGLNSDRKPEYRAVIFTGKESSIKTLRDLKGRTFAFGDRYSTQGHIIPRKMLEDAGIKLADLKSYVFTGSHANTARAVINGKYDAGGIQDNLATRLEGEGKIRIIALSRPYPSSLICYNRELDKEIVEKVKRALLDLEPLGRHSSILKDWDKTEMPGGFTEFSESYLKEIEDLVVRYGLLK